MKKKSKDVCLIEKKTLLLQRLIYRDARRARKDLKTGNYE